MAAPNLYPGQIMSPRYQPTSPSFQPTSPPYNCSTPPTKRTSPVVASPPFKPTSPPYQPAYLLFHPTSPRYQPTSPKIPYSTSTPPVLQYFLPFRHIVPLVPIPSPPAQLVHPEGNRDLSPSHWAEDGIERIASGEVDVIWDEFRHSIATSDALGKTSFSGNVPSDSDIKEFLRGADCYDHHKRQWRDVPSNCSTVQELFKPMRAIVDSIMEYFCYDSLRPVVDSFNIPRDKLEFRGPRKSSKQLSERFKQLPHMMAVGLQGSNFGQQPSPSESGPSYARAVSLLELQTEERIHFEDDLVQMAIYVRQCFLGQQNRRFVYVLLATELKVYLHVFDRSGVCCSLPFNIHTQAVDFVRMILGVWSPNDSNVGIDTSIYWKHNADGRWNRYINSCDGNGKPHTYLLSRHLPVNQRQGIVGRGTTCWTSLDDGEALLIKDAWRERWRPAESTFLREAKGLQGIVQIIEEKQGPCTSILRAAPPDPSDKFMDRQFSRTILKDYGSATIDKFNSPVHLLHGFRDAIAGHQRLWNAGILHCDISSQNVLLPSLERPGEEGVLIDLDLAICVDPARAESPICYHQLGTVRYMSLNVTEAYYRIGRKPDVPFTRDHMDDLESFYYLLAEICSKFTGPHEHTGTPDFVKVWDGDRCNSLQSAYAKRGGLLSPEHQPTSYFGPIFKELLDDFHRLCRRAASQKLADSRTGGRAQKEPSWSTRRMRSYNDYMTVFGIIDRALHKLKADEIRSLENRGYAVLRPPTMHFPPPLLLTPPPIIVSLPTLAYPPTVPLETTRIGNSRKRPAEEVCVKEEETSSPSPKRRKTHVEE
ncbi:hypothetical protein BDN70DRAFT_882988 [Pholiota conissans]|uniref:Fungal-type protein kinase domain-containing protein n=1 Tax=Pholiota conissans TaxID=109636 RepID=A0A9P5YVR9_9AGAR|nr:hypothetical protein BDN70DRAFT_882988 [Pholiota conissans]